MSVLSKRQEALLVYVWAYLRAQGIPPSQREIQAALLYQSISAVSYQLSRLQALGYVVLHERVARGIALTETGHALGQYLSRVREKDAGV